MITNINKNSIIKSLNRKKLPGYWNQYFVYENDKLLFDLTKQKLIEIIIDCKNIEKPFIDSQIVISKLLTDLGEKHIFHRQFNERHFDLHKEQILGMQLYKLIVEDNDLWIFHSTKNAGHIYSHATYFK